MQMHAHTLTSGWSGAIPNLIKPKGTGRASNISTWTSSHCWA